MKKKIVNPLFIKLFASPLKKCKTRIALVILSLFLLGLAQSAFLISIKPLFKFLFEDSHSTKLVLSSLLPKNLSEYFLFLNTLEIERSYIEIYLPLFIISSSAIKSIASYIYKYNLEAISIEVSNNYRINLFNSIISQNFKTLSGKSPSYWMSLIMNDVLYLQTRFSEIVSSLIKDSINILACLAVIFIYSDFFGWIILCSLPFLVVILGRVSYRIATYAYYWQIEISNLAQKVLDLRKRFIFIRSQQGENWEENIFNITNSKYFNTVKKSILLRSIFSPLVEYFGFIVFAIILFYVQYNPLLFIDSMSDLFAFLAAVAVLLKPLKNIGEQISRYQETFGSLKKSFAIFTSVKKINRGLKEPTLVIPNEITINKIRYGYEEKKPIGQIKDVSLKLGQMVAIVGESGTGKSSLLKTLSELIDPIHWDSSVQYKNFFSNCSYVSQFPFFFSDTIKNNLLYGNNQEISSQDIVDALTISDCYEEIISLPDGLDTKLRDININISGGQLQRLVICRAILRNSKILLLDEATSSVSEKSEERIIKNLKEYSQKKSILVICVTHRLKLLKSFDNIFYLENDEKCTYGNFNKLINNPSFKDYMTANL